jgi:hypothetical protein
LISFEKLFYIVAKPVPGCKQNNFKSTNECHKGFLKNGTKKPKPDLTPHPPGFKNPVGLSPIKNPGA